jgi:hypothetical protein
MCIIFFKGEVSDACEELVDFRLVEEASHELVTGTFNAVAVTISGDALAVVLKHKALR